MQAKDERLIELMAERLRVLGQPLRIRLLNELQAGEAHVQQLVAAVGAVQQNVSQHLAVLHGAGIVRRRKEGTRVWYTVADPHVSELLLHARDSVSHYVSELAESIDQSPPGR
jgi:DNA-binding transcriptional ArsR family regulator